MPKKKEPTQAEGIADAETRFNLAAYTKTLVAEAEAHAQTLRDQYEAQQLEASAILARALYGLQVGDILEVKDGPRPRDKYRMVIEWFDAENVDDPPSFHGHKLNADGAINQRAKAFAWDSPSTTWEKVGHMKLKPATTEKTQ